MQIPKKRNVVFDLLRGHFLLAILVDHLSYYHGRSIFSFYNGDGNLWVSAAEGFVFLTGFFVSYVYYPRINLGQVKLVFTKLWKKALQLFVLSVLLTLLYSLAGNVLGKAPYLGNGILYVNTVDIIIKTITFRYFYGWADILSLYVPLFIVAPVLLLLIKRKLGWLVFGLSVTVWLSNFYEVTCTKLCISYFDLASWQLLYVLGIISGTNLEGLKRVYMNIKGKALYTIPILGVFILSILLNILDSYYNKFTGPLKNTLNMIFNKETLGVGRVLLFFLWFTVFYLIFDRYKYPLSKYMGWILITFGKHSLLTYIIESAVLFIAYYYLPNNTWLSNSIFSFIIITFVWVPVFWISSITNKGVES
jgi:hypothetical protein